MSKDKPTNRKMKAFEVGEEVMAKWPGSDLWYEAIVESVDHQMKKCVVKYKDGQENGVSFSQMAVSSERFLNPFIKRIVVTIMYIPTELTCVCVLWRRC